MFKIRTYLLNARPKTFNPLSRLSRHSACRHGCRVQAACTIHIYVMCDSAMCKKCVQKKYQAISAKGLLTPILKSNQNNYVQMSAHHTRSIHSMVAFRQYLEGDIFAQTVRLYFVRTKNARASHSGPVFFHLQFNENILCGPVCVVKVYERMRWFLIKFFANQMCGQRTNYKNVGFLLFFDTFN